MKYKNLKSRIERIMIADEQSDCFMEKSMIQKFGNFDQGALHWYNVKQNYNVIS